MNQPPLNGFIAMPLSRHKQIPFLFFVTATCLLMLQTATGVCASSGPLALTHRTTVPERIHESGEWALLIFVTERGTHSQGIHGELYHKGKKVKGKRGDVRVTPFGRVHYHGSEAQRAELWQSSGWILHQGNGPMAPNTTPDEKSAPTHFGIG